MRGGGTLITPPPPRLLANSKVAAATAALALLCGRLLWPHSRAGDDPSLENGVGLMPHKALLAPHLLYITSLLLWKVELRTNLVDEPCLLGSDRQDALGAWPADGWGMGKRA